ncbi:MAG: hypothetical protein K6G16_07045 [Lachnospiraceae bacterium]|nr:hypothetical protein [Lachnospiraceae bacterium]
MQFGHTKPRRKFRLKGVILVLLFIAVAVCFLWLLNDFGKSTLERQQESLEKAIHRDLIQCYALEGIYPPDLAYLQEHYGLTWDTETFYVDYEPIASNLYPDVTVMKRTARR